MTALDVLSLADAKAEMRAEDTTAFDRRITMNIEAAVDLVSRETGLTLVGDDATEAPPAVRQAVVAALRTFYSGEVDISPRNAMHQLMRPHRRLARGS